MMLEVSEHQFKDGNKMYIKVYDSAHWSSNIFQDGEQYLKNLNVLMQKKYFNGVAGEIESNFAVQNYC